MWTYPLTRAVNYSLSFLQKEVRRKHGNYKKEKLLYPYDRGTRERRTGMLINNKKCTIIGPFLGPREKNGVEIFIGLPERSISNLSCKISQNGREIKSLNCSLGSLEENNIYKLFQFKYDDLEDNKLYSYEFFVDGESLELEGGLTEQDCNFKVLGEIGGDKSFILMSCHNPFQEEKGSADDGWAVWSQLSDHLEKDESVRLLVLGGDQVYNDDIEREYFKNLKKTNSSIETNLKKRFIEQYQKYWGNYNYRKVLASTLSVAMWDDHDITDGWGSRPESFSSKEGTGFKKNWWKFFEVASEVFKTYQASRNPKSIHKFSSVLDWGDKRFILADFRSERNAQKSQLWTKEHKGKVLKALSETPDQIKQVFFVSPVVALRTNFSDDKRMSAFSKSLFKLKRHIKKNKPWYIIQNWKRYFLISAICFLSPLLVSVLNCSLCEKLPMGIFSILYLLIVVGLPIIGSILFLWAVISRLPNLMTKIPELPDLSDDMEDGLSSSSNMKSLKEIMDCLANLVRKEKEVYILSGDIHIGGLTEIIDTREEPKIQMLQIVSSPIAYKPMHKVVAGLTTTSSEMILRELSDEKKLFARNIFYLSKRNFVQIFPDRKEGAIAFHFEGHKFPTVFPKKFL